MTSSLLHRVRSGIHFALLNRIVLYGIPAGVTLAAVKLVSPFEYGVYNVLLALGALVAKTTSLGWPDAIARYVPGMDREEDRRDLAGLLLQALLTRFLITGMTLLILIGLFGTLARIFGLQGYERAFQIFALGILFMTQNGLLTASLESLLMQQTLFKLGLLVSAFQITYLGFLFSTGGGLVGLIWMEVAKAFAVFLLQGSAILRAVGVRSLRQVFSWSIRAGGRTVTRYRWFSFLNDLGLEFLSTKSDHMLLSYLASNVQVALYAVPARLAKFVEVLIPLSLLKGPIESAFYRSYERDRSPANLNAMFQTLTKANLTVLGGLLPTCLVFGKPAFSALFGPQYAASASIFAIFLLFLALHHYPVGLALRAIERMDLILWGKVSIVLNLALAFPFVRWWGATGMALATVTALAVKNLLILLLARRLVRLDIPWAAVLRIAGNVGITLLVLLPTGGVWGNSLPGIFLGSAVGLLLYGTLTVLNPAYGALELQLAIRLLPERIQEHKVTRAFLDLSVRRFAQA